MAIQLISTPRFSSLQDPNRNERSESNSPPSDLGSDFDFSFRNSFVPELPSADELFIDGKIRPTEQVDRINLAPSVSRETNDDKGKKITRLKEFLMMKDFDTDDDETKQSHFWQFKRSSSLNCDRTQSKNLIKSSLRFLSRSNSTGSAPDPKPRKEPEKRSLQKQPSRKASVSSSSGGYDLYSSTRKPPLKDCRRKDSGVRVSPVLNIPQLFMSNGTMSFFGFNSLFCNGKVKKKKRS